MAVRADRHVALAAVVVAVMAAESASAADGTTTTLFSCWDQTFAYTSVGVRRTGDALELRLATQDEKLVQPLVPGTGLGWGQAVLQMSFPAAACRVDPPRHHLRCEGVPDTVWLRHGLHSRAGVVQIDVQALVATAAFGPADRASAGAAGQVPPGAELHVDWIGPDGLRALRLVLRGPLDCSGWPDPFAVD